MKPSDCHSAAAPICISSPAMPRKLAADRYSPEIAAAFHHGVTAREATSRSEVVRARRMPSVPSPSVPTRHAGDRESRDQRRLDELAEVLSRASARRRTAQPSARNTGERRHDHEPDRERDAEQLDAARAAAAGRSRAAARRTAPRTPPAPGARASAARGAGGAGRARRAPSRRPARRAECGCRAVVERQRGTYIRSLRRRSATWRRATGTSLPSASTMLAVPPSSGRISTARRRLTT